MTNQLGAALRARFESPAGQALAVLLLLVGVAGGMTWPQFPAYATAVANHWDPLLSMWRLGWIAHALTAAPASLFDAPIFHPEARTLAYTDAVLLPGLAAAPLIWSGAPLVAVYNTMLLGSMILSGFGAWLLAARLTGSRLAALVAALAFAFAPYRFDHYEHLELQASFAMPWTLLALERMYGRGRWIDALAVAGAFMVQVLCSIYYAVFLATLLPLYLCVRFPWRDLFVVHRTATLRLIGAMLAAGVLLLPYLLVYAHNRDVVGERSVGDLVTYSATLADFVHVHPDNLLLGRWLGHDTLSERRLFPGVTASLLAVAALVLSPRRRTIALAALALWAFLIALGIHGPLFPLLRDYVLPYRGLRVPARAAMLMQLGVAVLAAIALARLLPRAQVWRGALVGTVCAFVLLDGLQTPLRLMRPSAEPLTLSAWLTTRPGDVVLELPVPTPKRRYIADGVYMYAAAATHRWNPTLNGYSGFYPRSFEDLIHEMQTFPDDRSLTYLRSRGVDWIVVHRSQFKPDAYGRLLSAILARPDMARPMRFTGGGGEVVVFAMPSSPVE